MSKPFARLRLLASLAALASLALCTNATAQVTVGQVAPDLSRVAKCSPGGGYNEVQTAVADGASFAVPSAGVLTSWSTRSGGGSLSLVVYRPVAGSYLVLASDGPRVLTPTVVSTFPVALAVQPGDLVGIAVPPNADSDCVVHTELAGDALVYQNGNAPVGATIPLGSSETGYRVNVSANLLPVPTIATITPAAGSVEGEGVTIAGANFASVSAVAFGGIPAKSFTVDSEGQITAKAPPSKTLSKVAITVTTIAGTATSARTYAYEGCKVPKLKGKKLKATKKRARKADCKIGKVKKLGDATAKTGEVVKQNPKPGKILAPGTKIKVTLGD